MIRRDDLPRLLARAYLWMLLPCTLAMTLIVAPFNAPDETAHFLRAAAVANGDWVPQVARDRSSAGGRVDVNVAAFISDQWIQLETSLVGSRKADISRIASARPQHPAGRDTYAGHSNTALYPPFLYIVPASAMTIGGTMGLPLIAWLYLGRMANILTGGIIVAWAIRRAGEAAAPAFVVAALPMSMFLMATLSTDALLIPLAILFAALMARMVSGQPWQTRDSAGLSAATFVIGVGKIAYLPICLLPIFVIWRLDGGYSPRLRWFATLAVLCIASWIGWAWIVHDKVFSIRSGVAIDPFGQLRWIAHHPGNFVDAVLATLRGQGVALAQGMIGSPLGWFDIILPGALLSAWGMMIVCAACSAPTPAKRDFAILGSVLVAVLAQIAAIFLLLYLQYNPVGSAQIDGIQGRYFIPPLALLACMIPKKHLAAFARPTIIILPCLAGALATLAFVYGRFW